MNLPSLTPSLRVSVVNPRRLIGYHSHEIKNIGHALKSHPPLTEPLPLTRDLHYPQRFSILSKSELLLTG